MTCLEIADTKIEIADFPSSRDVANASVIN